MTLNFTAETSLELTLRSLSPAIQRSIESRLRQGRFASIPNGRVLLFDWTPAYLETTATVSVASTGAVTLTNTAVSPLITVPSDNSVNAPGTAMKPLGLEVFLISQPAAAGQLRDSECVVTLSKTGPAILHQTTLQNTKADEVSHAHWSSDQAAAWVSLAFSGIKQHGCRIVAMLIGQAP